MFYLVLLFCLSQFLLFYGCFYMRQLYISRFYKCTLYFLRVHILYVNFLINGVARTFTWAFFSFVPCFSTTRYFKQKYAFFTLPFIDKFCIYVGLQDILEIFTKQKLQLKHVLRYTISPSGRAFMIHGRGMEENTDNSYHPHRYSCSMSMENSARAQQKY